MLQTCEQHDASMTILVVQLGQGRAHTWIHEFSKNGKWLHIGLVYCNALACTLNLQFVRVVS